MIAPSLPLVRMARAVSERTGNFGSIANLKLQTSIYFSAQSQRIIESVIKVHITRFKPTLRPFN